MRSQHLAVLGMAAFLAVGVGGSALAQDVEADVAAISALYDQSALAVGTGDTDLYMDLFTEDVVVMPPGSPPAKGKGEVRPVIAGLFAAFDLELPYTVDEVEVPGDWAFARASFRYSLTPKEGGATTVLVGKELDIFKRQADGSWKIYIQCYNYDAPPPAPKAAGISRAPGLAKLAAGDDADAMYREMCDLYSLACTTGDIDLYVSNYTDDGIQMQPDGPTLTGSEQIRASMSGWFDLFNFVEEPIYPQDAEITGDWAFGRCDYSAILTSKEGGPAMAFEGKDLDIFKLQADGSWKYYISCWALNGPPTVVPTNVEATSWGQVKSQSE